MKSIELGTPKHRSTLRRDHPKCGRPKTEAEAERRVPCRGSCFLIVIAANHFAPTSYLELYLRIALPVISLDLVDQTVVVFFELSFANSAPACIDRDNATNTRWQLGLGQDLRSHRALLTRRTGIQETFSLAAERG